MAMQKILLGVLGAMEWVTSAGSLGTPAQVYTRTPRGPSEVIQLHLVEGSVPKKKWDSVAACKIIMQAAVPKIIAFAKKHQFDEPKEYKYVAAPNALQIDVGDRNLAAALCSIDSPAFDKTFLLVPGLQLYASSVQVGRIPQDDRLLSSMPAQSGQPEKVGHRSSSASLQVRCAIGLSGS
ncbi:hypothetical protein DIPPA_04028 [Diplonema papillatum]|nr:hypothetical protein DIPPA_04028 [Diplonema papillatum]